MFEFWIFLACLLSGLTIPIILARLLFSITTVWGKSMYPTLNHGDRILLLRYWPTRWLRKGQIVVGKLPIKEFGKPDNYISYLDSDSLFLRNKITSKDMITITELPIKEDSYIREELYIKRVIGLPGDIVTLSTSDFHEIMRPSLQEKCNTKGYLVWHIPDEHYFVKGDASISGDSVNWGPIPLKSFIGIALLKFPRQADMNKIKPPPSFPESI